MKVLVVEDNTDNRKLLRYTFEHHGCTVIEAKDGKEGLELASAHRPDIVVSDALMPVMDGFLLLRALKSDQELRSIPFFFYSATYTGQKEVKLAESLGAEAFMIKPKEPEDLWQEVNKTIQARKQLKQANGPATGEDEQFLSEYSQIVATKLEDKMKELEEELAQRKASEEEIKRLNMILAARAAELEASNNILESCNNNLKELNISLEQRISDAVVDSRKKDQILILQGRQAAMGEMIGNIAHQWRQPLNTLGLIVQELLLTYGRDEFSKESLEANVKKAMGLITQMSKTIEDFSNYFRPGKEKVLFSVNKAVAKALFLLEPNLKYLNIDTDVIEIDNIDINGYSNEYSQVLLNILLNCKDAFEASTIDKPRFITITIFKENNRSLVTIADNAGGIPENVMDKIYDPYFTTKGPDKGTGIGLYMAKAIIEKNMGGRLTVRNTADGAEFRVEV
jgi:C4-dicarboxylate-specific signal transduction histidine kinase